MSDRRKEAEEKMEKAIFISADCWLEVFDLLPPSQLGLGIALISHRFDFYVDEHFKTRKWALGIIQIRPKVGENSAKEMEIDNFNGKSLPIPKIELPRKVNGFKQFNISCIDQNAIAFLHRFRQLFAKCPINLAFGTTNERISELILRNIWPMIAKNICAIEFYNSFFRRLRPFVPSLFNDCPSLGIVSFNAEDMFPEFPPDDSATASDGQAVAKWLFTPLQNNVRKVLKCYLDTDDGIFASRMEAFKAAFASASSRVNFIAVIRVHRWPFAASIVPFALTNELTREQLALKRINKSDRFLLIRCPIARDESKWTKWEEEAIGWRIYGQWNQIGIYIYDGNIVDTGLE
ncbi:hypothetical protein niasHT_032913 [Heterodera trifolii]|uniref:F-box domain-containing protein n=1 Tax=Heterodera trifolii TaxID=157864 RepID=A0ABD2IST3_9BILA